MRYLIKHKDGSIGIMTTIADGVSPSDEFSKWTSEKKNNIHSFREVEELEIPEDRYFRNAWTHLEDKIHIDIEKCKNIHREVIRNLRKHKLEELDIEYIRASESNDEIKKADIVIRKQELRDLPSAPEIENAKTPEEIKNFMPKILL